MHVLDVEWLKRTSNEYVTHSFNKPMSDGQQTNMYWTIRTHTGCITDKPNTERTSTGAFRIQHGIFANAFLQQTSFRQVALQNASPQCLVEESKKRMWVRSWWRSIWTLYKCISACSKAALNCRETLGWQFMVMLENPLWIWFENFKEPFYMPSWDYQLFFLL